MNFSDQPQQVAPLSPADVSSHSRFRGCLLGGAVGDALGAPVEFLSRAEIVKAFGPEGIANYTPAYGGIGTITDDTQMTLFTAEGLLRAWILERLQGVSAYTSETAKAYLRWLQTQGLQPDAAIDMGTDPGWLFQQTALHRRRAPGNTCLAALSSMTTLGEAALNHSKGCGGVMRVAPVGLFAWRDTSLRTAQQAFRLGTELAALTHGHPTGALTGGVLAAMIRELAAGSSLPAALATAKMCLAGWDDHMETLQAIEMAQTLAASGEAHDDAIAALGEGWIAEEALAISVYCALVAQDFRHGVVLAVNHDGDSDSTGTITGNLLGALLGEEAIPSAWLAPLELREVIAKVADDLYEFPLWGAGFESADGEFIERIRHQYPA